MGKDAMTRLAGRVRILQKRIDELKDKLNGTPNETLAAAFQWTPNVTPSVPAQSAEEGESQNVWDALSQRLSMHVSNKKDSKNGTQRRARSWPASDETNDKNNNKKSEDEGNEDKQSEDKKD